MDVRVWSDGHRSFWRCDAGSVGVLRLEWRGICGACRFVPRSWSASVYSSKAYDYLGALWEILRVIVATYIGQGMDDHPDCVSTCTPLQNQLCYATWVTYTCVALLLRRPFLAIESCFVHLWRNQVVDHFKLKSRDSVFGWKFIKDFPSSHIHKWKRFGPGFFWCITVFFFKLFDFCLCNVLVLCHYFLSTSVSLF